jgi:hypothetical protein
MPTNGPTPPFDSFSDVRGALDLKDQAAAHLAVRAHRLVASLPGRRGVGAAGFHPSFLYQWANSGNRM